MLTEHQAILENPDIATFLAREAGLFVHIAPVGSADLIASEADRARVLAKPDIVRFFRQTETIVSKPKPKQRKRRKGRNTYKPWTPKIDAKIRRLVSERKTSAEIGKIIGRSGDSVSRRRSDLGIKKPPPKVDLTNPSQTAQFIKFRKAGWTLSRIAELFGTHESQISKVLSQNGFKGVWRNRSSERKVYKCWTDTEMDLLKRHIDEGVPLSKVVHKFPDRNLSGIYKKAWVLKKSEPILETVQIGARPPLFGCADKTSRDWRERERTRLAYRNRTRIHISNRVSIYLNGSDLPVKTFREWSEASESECHKLALQGAVVAVRDDTKEVLFKGAL